MSHDGAMASTAKPVRDLPRRGGARLRAHAVGAGSQTKKQREETGQKGGEERRLPREPTLAPSLRETANSPNRLQRSTGHRRNARSLYRESPQDASSSTSPALDAPILAESASTPSTTAILQHLVVLLQLPGSGSMHSCCWRRRRCRRWHGCRRSRWRWCWRRCWRQGWREHR